MRTASAVNSRRRQAQRQTLAWRYGYRCHLCGETVHLDVVKGKKGASIDHLVPLSFGGTNALENLRLAHAGCNVRRGNQPIELAEEFA